MDGNKCILQLRGVRPFLSDKFDISKHKNYRFLSDADEKNIFDIGKHVNRKLIVKPNEKCEIHEYTPPSEEYASPPEDDIPDEAFDDFEIDLEPV